MVITTAANQMFAGVTGVYGICLDLSAAVASFSTPMFARFIPYNVCMAICTLASLLSYLLCTLPQPISDGSTFNKAGPVIGTVLAGFVYAFGSNTYMAVAAFFPSEAVLALSVGSGFSIILGPGVFIGITSAFDQNWRKALLVFLFTGALIPFVWWGLFDRVGREAAELSRLGMLRKTASGDSTPVTDPDENINIPQQGILDGNVPENPTGKDEEAGVTVVTGTASTSEKPGFSATRTRRGLLFKKIMPKYVFPLLVCTTCATVNLFGVSTTTQTLERFRAKPSGDLEFEVVCELLIKTPLSFFFLSIILIPSIVFAYGSAQFIFSTLSALRPMPNIWAWSLVQLFLAVVGIIQLWHPFLTYYGVWVLWMFMVGACVGGGVTNTNYKIAEDFRRSGEPDEVRSFAMSYAGLGNFGGDALGGALGLVIQVLASRSMRKWTA